MPSIVSHVDMKLPLPYSMFQFTCFLVHSTRTPSSKAGARSVSYPKNTFNLTPLIT